MKMAVTVEFHESLNCAHTQTTKYPSGYITTSKTNHPISHISVKILGTSSLTVVFVDSTSLGLKQPVSWAKGCAGILGVDICERIT